jgi:hypothetical protein
MPVIPLINPNRPPKKWWHDCVDGVKKSSRKSGRAYSPQSVCGSLWYHKMSAAQRKAATKRHEGAEMLSPRLSRPKRKNPFMKKTDITSIERGKNGQWIISAIVDGQLIHKQYYDYTKQEAIRLFMDEIKKNPFMVKPKVAKRWYVGTRGTAPYSMFQSEFMPTKESHGHLYNAVIGPFSTRLGALIMARHGAGNPHLQCVADAEAFARRGTQWLLDNGFNIS